MFGPGLGQIIPHGTAAGIHFRSHFAAGEVVVLPQNPCRHVSCTGAHGGELKAPSRILLEGDASGRSRINGTRNLIDWLSQVPIVHLDYRLTGLLNPGRSEE